MCKSIAEGGRRCDGRHLSHEQHTDRANHRRARDRVRAANRRNLERIVRNREHREQLAATFDPTAHTSTSLTELRDGDNFRAWVSFSSPEAEAFIAAKVAKEGEPLPRSLANSAEVRALALHGLRDQQADTLAEQRAEAGGHLDDVSDDELWERAVKEGTRAARKTVNSAIRKGQAFDYSDYALALRSSTRTALNGMGSRAHLDGIAQAREQQKEQAREEARALAAVKARAEAERDAEREAEREARAAEGAARRAAVRAELKAAAVRADGDEDTSPLSPAEEKVSAAMSEVVDNPVKEFVKLLNRTTTAAREAGLSEAQQQRIINHRLQAAGFDGHVDGRVLVPHTDAMRRKMLVGDRRRYQHRATGHVRERWYASVADDRAMQRYYDVGTNDEVRAAMTEVIQAGPDLRPRDMSNEISLMANVFSSHGGAQVEPIDGTAHKAPTAYTVTWGDQTWTIPVHPDQPN